MSRTINRQNNLRSRRHKRIRVLVSGTAARPRISVFRSNLGVYAQLIDDVKGVTLAAADTREAKGKTALLRAREAGALLARRAKEKGIETAVFDRSGYVYAGKIKAVADGAREGGLAF